MTSTQITFPSGNTAENLAYIGPEGSLSYDNQVKRFRFHDGVTPGGFGLVKTDGDTMGGPLSFARQTHAGIRLNNLSSFSRDSLQNIQPGMMIWNINLNRVQVVNQSRQWVTVAILPEVEPPVASNFLIRTWKAIKQKLGI